MAFTGKATLTSKGIVANEWFWPDVLIDELLSGYRVPAEYADDTIKLGVTLSLIKVNESLRPIRSHLEALGFDKLEQYHLENPNTIGGESVLIVQYKHAVFARAKAFLLQQFNSLNRRPAAENAAKEAPETEQYWLDQSQSAIHYFFALLLPAANVTGNDGFYASLM